MGRVKCQYTELECRQGNCWRNEGDGVRALCEGFEEGSDDWVTCRSADSVTKYIEGDYKRIIWDGQVLELGKNRQILGRINNVFSESETGIDYLEIDGNVIIDERDNGEVGGGGG